MHVEDVASDDNGQDLRWDIQEVCGARKWFNACLFERFTTRKAVGRGEAT